MPVKFLNLKQNTPDTDKSFLGLGLTDALITRLSNLRNVTVRPTSAVLKYMAETEDLFEVERKLQTDFVLDGRITSIGERLRITVRPPSSFARAI